MHEALRRPAAAPAAPTPAPSAHNTAPLAAPLAPAQEDAAAACAQALQRKPLFRLDQVVADPAPATPTPPPGRPLHGARDTAPTEMVARFRRRFQAPDAGPVQTRPAADGLASGLEAMAHQDIARIAAGRAAAPRPAAAPATGDLPLQAKFTFNAPDDHGGFKDEQVDYESAQTDFAPDTGYAGNTGRFHSVTSDSNLPTFYGVLSKLFGADNVVKASFASTGAGVGNTCDRPHKVSAKGWYNHKDMRTGEQFVTGIGYLGNEQLLLQEGATHTGYHGGHLVGYQVLGGPQADQQWNVAPQEANNNQYAYNNSIEGMVRGVVPGTTFDYEVTLRYRSTNIEVDQGQLARHGMIKNIDPTKPWKLQLPNRIPVEWKTKATKTGAAGRFGSPAAAADSSTYNQLVDTLPDAPIAADAAEKAAFTLTMTRADASPIDTSEDYKAAEVQTVTFHAKQYFPVNRDASDKPPDFAGADATNFGSTDPIVDVKEDITLADVIALQNQIMALEARPVLAPPAPPMFEDVRAAFGGGTAQELLAHFAILEEEADTMAMDFALADNQDADFKFAQATRSAVTVKRKAIHVPATATVAEQQTAYAQLSVIYEQAQIFAATEDSVFEMENNRVAKKSCLKLDAKTDDPVPRNSTQARTVRQMFDLPRRWQEQLETLDPNAMLDNLGQQLRKRKK